MALEELPSSPLPSWQQPPLCSSSLNKPAPMTPLSFDPSVAYTAPGKFSLSVRPGQLMTIGCVLAVSSPQILSAPLLAFLKKGGVVKAVSPWYCVAWNTLFSVRSNFQEKYVVCPCLV